MDHAHASRSVAAVQLRVLGALEVRRHGEAVPLHSARQRALLARLLVDAGRVVGLDALVDALWGEEPPADPRNAVQTYVARLRKTLGPDVQLVTREPGYLLEVGPEAVDARRFEELLARAQREGPARARQQLDGALGLWRGPAYAEFADGFARAEALRLDERRLVALEERAACRLELGEVAEVDAELKALIAEHPWRERFVELRMRALAALGRDGEALAAYRAYREGLVEETGLDPSEALGELERAILRGELTGAAHAEPAAVSPARPTTDPALALTSLVGRDAEVAAVHAALQTHRLVTLTGPGGVGKTRIAAEVDRAAETQRVADEAAWDEVAWVELAALVDADAVPHAVAAAAGADLPHGQLAAPDAFGALAHALAGRRLLVVLNNAEHLLETVAPAAHALARHAAPVRVLATSRERLAVEGEHVVPVAPLATEADDDVGPPAAVRLFVERAAAGGADVPGELVLVEAICRQLDGLPLAIELAAARAGAVPLAELQTALAEDAPAVVGVRRGQPERHRDLWAVVDWSHRLLDTATQGLFERLSVFAGAVDVDLTHAVCAPEGQRRADTVAQLAELAERSLLTRAGDGTGDTRRYRMLRPVRAVARQRLADRGEAGDVADRHAAAMVACAERAAGPPLTDEGRRWLEAAIDDLRTARRRARLSGDAALLARLVTAVFWFDYWRPGTELLGWADEVLELAGDDPHAAGLAVHAAATTAAWMDGDLQRARRLAQQAAALTSGSDDPARLLALWAAGDVAFFEGHVADAEAAFGELVRLARHHDDPDAEASGLAAVALAQAYTGRVAEAAETADEADRAATRAGPAVRAFARYARGECRAETESGAALARVEEAVDLAAGCGAWFVEGVARLTAASLRARRDDPAAAAPAYAELLWHWRRSGNWTQQWTTLRNVVELLARLELDEPAVVIAAAAEADPSAAPTFGAESDRLEQALAATQDRLGAERFDAARQRGKALAAHEVLEVALQAVDRLSGSACASQTTQ